MDSWSSATRRILAPNAGPMTLDGTNSYLIGAEGAGSVVVVDPGPEDPAHLDALAGVGRVALILITHHHADHTEGAAALARRTGAPVRAIDPALCIDAAALTDGEVIAAGDITIRVVATPGHTADSACLHLPTDGPTGSVLTGDTILGRGTSIIADPDGALGPYLHSLEVLRALGPATVLPGHGPALPDLAAICDAYLAHRNQRLDEVRAALSSLGPDAPVGAVADLVYAGIEPAVRPAAEASLRAQLAYLRRPVDGTRPPA